MAKWYLKKQWRKYGELDERESFGDEVILVKEGESLGSVKDEFVEAVKANLQACEDHKGDPVEVMVEEDGVMDAVVYMGGIGENWMYTFKAETSE